MGGSQESWDPLSFGIPSILGSPQFWDPLSFGIPSILGSPQFWDPSPEVELGPEPSMVTPGVKIFAVGWWPTGRWQWCREPRRDVMRSAVPGDLSPTGATTPTHAAKIFSRRPWTALASAQSLVDVEVIYFAPQAKILRYISTKVVHFALQAKKNTVYKYKSGSFCAAGENLRYLSTKVVHFAPQAKNFTVFKYKSGSFCAAGENFYGI